MKLSNFVSLDIGAHICEDHFLKFLIECTLCADIAKSECGKKTQWNKKWGGQLYIRPLLRHKWGEPVALVPPRIDALGH